MSTTVKLQALSADSSAPSRRVVRDFALLLGVALGIGVIAGLGMMLTVLLIA